MKGDRSPSSISYSTSLFLRSNSIAHCLSVQPLVLNEQQHGRTQPHNPQYYTTATATTNDAGCLLRRLYPPHSGAPDGKRPARDGPHPPARIGHRPGGGAARAATGARRRRRGSGPPSCGDSPSSIAIDRAWPRRCWPGCTKWPSSSAPRPGTGARRTPSFGSCSGTRVWQTRRVRWRWNRARDRDPTPKVVLQSL